MLILTRKIGEEIRINDDIVIKIVRLHGNQVAIGIAAPAEVSIHRQEIYDRIQSANNDESENIVPLKTVEV